MKMPTPEQIERIKSLAIEHDLAGYGHRGPLEMMVLTPALKARIQTSDSRFEKIKDKLED